MEKITDIAVSAPSGEDALPDFSPPSKTEIGWKKRRVKNIMKSIHKVLRRDIGEVTETALMRKSEVQLKDLEKSLKKKKSRTLLSRIGLRNRVGCIFLEIGDESIQI